MHNHRRSTGYCNADAVCQKNFQVSASHTHSKGFARITWACAAFASIACSCNHSAGGSEDPQLVLHNMTLIVLKDASEWNGK